MPQTVLFVDDVPSVTAAFRRCLRQEPYRILEATSGAEAIRILDEERIDVVVTDESMPGMSGSTMLAKVYQDHPDVIGMILTGRPTVEMAMRAINEGRVYRFFTKPCEPQDMAVAIRQALREQELLAENRRLSRQLEAQAAELSRLEAQHPGITRVERDAAGAVLIEVVGLRTPRAGD
jgi:DNA-binding NtrC family response regulator